MIYKEIIKDLAFQACSMIEALSDDQVTEMIEHNRDFFSYKNFKEDKFTLKFNFTKGQAEIPIKKTSEIKSNITLIKIS